MAELPGYAATLAHTRAGDAALQWEEAVGLTRALAAAFDKASQAAPANLAEPTSRLGAALATLRAWLAGQADPTKHEPNATNAAAVLASSRFTNERRKDYWSKWQGWSVAQTKAVQAAEEKLRSPPASPSKEGFGRDEADRALWRARMAAGLARLAGEPFADAWDQYARAAQTAADPAAWEVLGPKLAAWWAREAGASGASGTAGERARRAAKLRQEFWAFLAERYQREAAVRGTSDRAPPYYEKAILDAKDAAARAANLAVAGRPSGS
jgi:hypothetical protein